MKGKHPDFTKMAKEVYRDLHEDAPPDIQTWDQLHVVERSYLVKFTREVYINTLIILRTKQSKRAG